MAAAGAAPAAAEAIAARRPREVKTTVARRSKKRYHAGCASRRALHQLMSAVLVASVP
ncbi:hypothetical protein C7S16_1197 [Burkholderia thailandensis]|uniref:Uncharacterized protein n=1 Tax=Burkholderia thailandensis TaxID=57975 RepID=A0AAW9CYF2_BURTH|nr:hypothetical protein [Burkholderia thailandensis]MDW9255629.1 hypothetical protein [Burkholderia thailandensis]